MSQTWIKAIRDPIAFKLMKASVPAFVLLYVISYRAQRTTAFNRFGLTPGQALIGDYEEYGLTQREYRTAKKKLEKFGFATFKATSRGTIATLVDSTIFDINAEGDKEASSQGPSGVELPTTTKNVNNEKNGKTTMPSRIKLTNRLGGVMALGAPPIGTFNGRNNEESL